MFEYDKRLLKTLNFNTLYPPEGDSSVLEVSSDGSGDFLHVTLSENGALIFSFFSGHEINLTLDQINAISDVARERLTVTDTSWLEKNLGN